MQYRSSWMTEELDVFRDQFRKFLAKDLAPHAKTWRDQKMVDRSAWRALGEMGALLPSVPEIYGGLGANFAYEAAVIEDIETVVPEVTTGISVHSAIVAHYILNYGSEEQKLRWLPKMASGEFVGAIAMTEPGTGSDLQGVRTTAKKQGNNYVINGQKTFITNGQAADLIIVVARTGEPGAKGISLIVLRPSTRICQKSSGVSILPGRRQAMPMMASGSEASRPMLSFSDRNRFTAKASLAADSDLDRLSPLIPFHQVSSIH